MVRSSHEDLVEWYRTKTGTTPGSDDDIERLWHEEFLRLNPRRLKHRNLVVEYAERHGGIELQYLRLRFPDYWGQPRGVVDPETYAEVLGVPDTDLQSMYVRMLTEIAPKLFTAEYDRAPLRFPEVLI